MEYSEYIMAESLEQAWELNQKKSNVILGGMTWLKMQKMQKKAAVDLSALGLGTIEETESEFRIGCMTSLRALEMHEGFRRYTDGAIYEALRHIVGVQFRNTATVGGSIFGRFGFSDVLTIFMVLGTKVELYKGGIVPIEEFARMKRDNDILVRLIVPKTSGLKVCYKSVRNTQTDFPVLTLAASREEPGVVCAAVGARPMQAVQLRFEEPENSSPEESARAFAEFVRDNVVTGSNLRGSASYRSHLAEVLAERAARQLYELQK